MRTLRRSPPRARTEQWRTLFVVTRALAGIVAALLLALRPDAGHDGLLAVLALTYAVATCAAVTRFRSLGGAPWFWIVDVAVSIALIYAAGDWRSPFSLLLLSALILPSTALSVRSAVAFATVAVACFLGVGILRGVDWPTVRTTPRLESFAEHLFVPILIALLLSYAARLLDRLAAERARSEHLAVETERRRIAWDLHDSAKQRLNAANLLLSAIETSNGHAEALEQVRGEVRSAMVDMDTSIHDNGLPSTVSSDLVAAVRRRAAELQQVSAARIEVSGSAPQLPHPAAAHVFRIAQEAVLNAVRHAGAEHIEVRFEDEAGCLRLTVCDDGVGVPGAVRPGAAGIRSMRNRAASLGGELVLEPGAYGQGTAVRLQLPVAPSPAAAP